MEEMSVNALAILTTYGPMGAITIYFAYKDMVLNKALTEALNKFTIAMNACFLGKAPDEQ